jgi:cytoskeletal protein RodZ
MEQMISNKKIVRFVGISVGVIVVSALVVWYMINVNNRKNAEKTLTPMQQLQELEAKSAPVTSTTEERALDLKKLDKSSKTVNTSVSDRLKELDSLSN